MRLRCRLREIRGKRPLKHLADESGVARATLNLIENGRQLPKDEHIPAIEQAYGAPFESWYGEDLAARRLLSVLAPDEGEAA